MSIDEPWTAAWERMLGGVPRLATDLRQIAPPAETGYRTLREWIYTDHPDGLPRALKELLMVVISITKSNPAGATAHVRMGLANGLTEMQLREALAQCFLCLGLVDDAAGMA